MWEITHSKSDGFYDCYERKGGDIETTHYCPGCGHGVLHKLIAEAVVDLGIQDRTIFVTPVGCSVFAYYYLDLGHVQASHGRAPAVATGIKRVRPEAIVISYQGDGDLAAIGGNEILHTASRGENISAFFVNNGIYGMTGGQMAPTTPIGVRTTTSPSGRRRSVEGYPLRMCELLATLEAPVYIERVALTDPKQHMRARKAVRRALQNQIEGRGFSFVEVLSACPTGWKATPQDAIHWVEKNLVPTFPLGVYKDVSGNGDQSIQSSGVSDTASRERSAKRAVQAEPPTKGALAKGELREVAVKISGFGGQGILFAGVALAEAGMKEGLQVSWIPSYGPEMRGGTAHCHVRLSADAIPSPLISKPTAVLAFNEPSVERFTSEIVPGGLLMVNSSMVKEVPSREDIKVLSLPATEVANDLGDSKVANMVMVGAYIELTRALDPESILSVMSEHGIKPELQAYNRKALEAGRRFIDAAS